MKKIKLILATIVCVAGLLLDASAASSSKKKSSSSSGKSKAKSSQKAIPRPQAFDANGVPIVSAASVVVVDAATGKILHTKNPDAPRPAASTQKLLTALIVAEAGNLDKRVVVQASDTWAEPSKLYLKVGESYTRRQLLEILLVRSMNDVAVALARDNAGSVEAFSYKMNAKARDLGARNSWFVNPNGLPAPAQKSNARDMACVAIAAYRNPVLRQIVNMRNLTFQYADGRVRTFENTNKLLMRTDYCNGMKTGYTNAAGKCLIASGRSGKRDVIAVLLGDSPSLIWRDAGALLTWGLQG